MSHSSMRALAAGVIARPYPVMAALLTIAAFTEVLARTDASGLGLIASLSLALTITAPVAWLREHWAVPVVVAGAAAVSLLLTSQTVTFAGVIALVITFYVTAQTGHGRLAAVLVTPFVLLALVALASSTGSATVDEANAGPAPADDAENAGESESESTSGVNGTPILVAGLVSASAVLGQVRRNRRTEAQLQATEAAMSSEAVEHSARGERVRIARELHDVVAHRISSIAVQAETARLTTPGISPDGERQLAAIGDSARDALTEMRQLLGVLRKDAADADDRQPQPGIEQIAELIDEAGRLSNATVRLVMTGRPTRLDPSVELTAYRVVQESLTNIRRHAAGATVDVELDFGDRDLTVRVRDSGGDAPHAPSQKSDRTTLGAAGHGLIGMRERVEMVGGRLATGATKAGGFLVEAALPRADVDQPVAVTDSPDGPQ